MTDEEIAIEYEASFAFAGEKLKTCPRCEQQTNQPACPHCSTEGEPMNLTGDGPMDKALYDIEQGKEIDLEAIARQGFIPVDPQGEA